MASKLKLVLVSAAVAMLTMVFGGGTQSTGPPKYNYSNYDVTISCALPDVPETLPVLRTIYVPVDREAIEAIARDVFGLSYVKYYHEGEDGRVEIGDIGMSLLFHGLHDIYFDRWPKEALTGWSEEDAVEAVEAIVSRLESHWETPTEVEHTLDDVKKNRDHLNTSLPVVGVLVEYLQSYQVIELGGGACFAISVADDTPIYAYIRKPIVEVEGSDPITVTPSEAVEKALSGESAQRALGVHVIPYVPVEGCVNVTEISLIYYFDDAGRTDYLIPVYRIEAEVHGPSLDNGLPVDVTLREVVFASERTPERAHPE